MLLTHKCSYLALANILHLIVFTTQQNCTADDTVDNSLISINITQSVGQDSFNETQEQCDCSCGLANHVSDMFSPRIINGVSSAKNEFPWMIRLSVDSNHVCGGSLINDRYVLTAAHCLHNTDVEDLIVTFGEHDRCKDKNPVTRVVLEAIGNGFNFRTTENDILLLKLNESVPITEQTIRPICLPPDDDVTNPDDVTTVAGWGFMSENSYVASCELQRVDLPVVDNAVCAKVYGFSSNEHGMQKKICAGYKAGGMDACQGDSGGPLMKLMDDGRYMIAGIVSGGNGCARPDSPGHYTKVSQYLQFIRNNTKDACFCSD